MPGTWADVRLPIAEGHNTPSGSAGDTAGPDDTTGPAGVDDASGPSVVAAAAEQVARHVLVPEAVSPMVKNTTSYPRMAAALGSVSGKGVPTSR